MSGVEITNISGQNHENDCAQWAASQEVCGL